MTKRTIKLTEEFIRELIAKTRRDHASECRDLDIARKGADTKLASVILWLQDRCRHKWADDPSVYEMPRTQTCEVCGLERIRKAK